jgi:hypothetical protein
MKRLKRLIPTGLVAGAAAASALYAGNAQAVQCTFGNLSACNTTVGNVTFSDFTRTNPGSDGADANDTINVLNPVGNIYTISPSFQSTGGILGGPIALSGLSFKATTASGYSLLNMKSNSDVVNSFGLNSIYFDTTADVMATSLYTTGNQAGPNPFDTNSTAANILTNWYLDTPADAANGYSLTITIQQTPVPGPLPVMGAASAFCFSRKLRRRIKASA